MRVLQVVPRIKDQSSGPSYSVTRLCGSLHERGQEVSLHVLNPGPDIPPNYEFHVHACRRFPGARRLGWSPDMDKALRQAEQHADIVHNHSMWMMPNIYTYRAARSHDSRFVFSPRGTLSEWALSRSRLRKKLVWWYGQKAALHGADCLHATSEIELQEIRALGMTQPVAVIPNGIDIPDAWTGDKDLAGTKKLVFLSRIHPKKGLDLLLTSWRTVQDRYPEWELLIVGPLTGTYADQIQNMAAKMGVQRVSFTGEATGARKRDILMSADLFVLPTHSENFGLAIAESLAHGTPVVVTRGAPWSGVEANGCGWWIDHGEEALRVALEEAMSLSSVTLAEMGQCGREWMKRDFAWEQIGEKMLRTYQWLTDNAQKPDWVITDGY